MNVFNVHVTNVINNNFLVSSFSNRNSINTAVFLFIFICFVVKGYSQQTQSLVKSNRKLLKDKLVTMNWYAGNIAEAVNLAKTRGAVFVVYVEGIL